MDLITGLFLYVGSIITILLISLVIIVKLFLGGIINYED